MHKDFFSFKSIPFGITPDVRFFYESAIHRAMLSQLRHAIESRSGLVLVAGEAGTGKTILVKRLIQNLEQGTITAHLFEPLVDFDQMLRLTLNAFGLRNFAADRMAMSSRLHRYLNEQRFAEHIVCLVIDEAQDSSIDALNGLRWLSNLETENEKLLQIVLVGQCDLERHLDRPELSQLRQRVAFRCRLEPLAAAEVDKYIASRLHIVGYNGPRLFDAAAVARIAAYSQGIPRVINILCDNALEGAGMAGQSIVHSPLIDQVAREQGLETARGQQSFGKSAAGALWQADQAGRPVEPVDRSDGKLSAQKQEFDFASDYGVVDADGRLIGSERRGRGWRLSVGALLMIFVTAVGLAPLYYPERAQYVIASLREAVASNQLLKRLNVEVPGASEQKLAGISRSTIGPPASAETPPSEELNEQKAASEPATYKPRDPEAKLNTPEHRETLLSKKHGEPPVKKTSPSEPPLPASRQPPGSNDNIESRVSRAMRDRALNGVDVSVRAGFVTLAGRVATLRQKLLAGRVARELAGAEFVHNEIIVDWNAAPPIQ